MNEDNLMSDQATAAASSAGGLLRSARELQGLSLEHLASLLKVTVLKLEALEADRHDQLPGRAFVRSLAMSVCRQLDMDALPVLEALPALVAPSSDLEHVTRGLATPFHATDARILPGFPATLPDWLRPGVSVPVVLLLLALAFWMAPGARTWLGGSSPAAKAGEAASAAEFSVSTAGLASGVLAASAPMGVGAVGAVGGATAGAVDAGATGLAGAASATAMSKASVGAVLPATMGASAPASAASGVLVITTVKGTWLEVRDSRAVVASRTLPAGEVLTLDGQPPFKLKIGNALGVQITYQGLPVDLTAATKDNIVRLELK